MRDLGIWWRELVVVAASSDQEEGSGGACCPCQGKEDGAACVDKMSPSKKIKN